METGLEQLLAEGVVSEVLARLQSGKEAEVYVVRFGGKVVAAKVYKDRATRSFKNNADYKEGRAVRNSRSARAIASGSRFGKAAAEDAWKASEADALYKLHDANVRVPTPVLYLDGVLLMELVLDETGNPARRLIDTAMTVSQANDAYHDMIGQLVRILACDLIHGDLSPYNVLAAVAGPTVIDFPQIISASHNSSSERFFRRDAENILGHFASVDRSLHARHGDVGEIWRAYLNRELTPEFRPTGRSPTRAQPSTLVAPHATSMVTPSDVTRSAHDAHGRGNGGGSANASSGHSGGRGRQGHSPNGSHGPNGSHDPNANNQRANHGPNANNQRANGNHGPNANNQRANDNHGPNANQRGNGNHGPNANNQRANGNHGPNANQRGNGNHGPSANQRGNGNHGPSANQRGNGNHGPSANNHGPNDANGSYSVSVGQGDPGRRGDYGGAPRRAGHAPEVIVMQRRSFIVHPPGSPSPHAVNPAAPSSPPTVRSAMSSSHVARPANHPAGTTQRARSIASSGSLRHPAPQDSARSASSSPPRPPRPSSPIRPSTSVRPSDDRPLASSSEDAEGPSHRRRRRHR